MTGRPNTNQHKTNWKDIEATNKDYESSSENNIKIGNQLEIPSLVKHGQYSHMQKPHVAVKNQQY